jgi:hypothetical protein
VQATDSLSPGAQTATQPLTITVTGPLTITTTSLPSGIVGMAYTQTLSGTGGTTPYTWSLASGQLPTGLTLSPDGTISGTPTAAGSFNIAVQLADSASQTVTQTLSLTITSSLTISTTTLPNGSLNQPYNTSVAATGGLTPYVWTLSTGTLPPGLTLNPDGTITGTPTAAGAALFTLVVADSAAPIADTANQSYTIQISAPLTITTTSLATGITNALYTQTLDATGGTPPYSWSLLSGTLPAGLSLSTSGTISGTPAAPGGATITVQVKDSATQGTQTSAQQFTLTIIDALTITTTTLPTGLQTVPYSQALAAAGGTPPYTWSLVSGGQLPAGLAIAPDGTISGMPTAAGAFPFTVQVSDASQPAQTATHALTLIINAPLAITTATLPNPKDGNTYSQVLAASGGTVPYVWSIINGSLPTGLVLTPNGVIAGTATGPGAFTFAVQVTDTTQPTPETAQANFDLQTLASFQITTGAIPPGIVGVAYSTTLAASGGATPYTWIVTSGSLAPGLNLSFGGTISGTPTTAGNYNFTTQATDSASPNRSSTATFNVQIQPPLTITTSHLSDTSVGATYQASLAATGGNPPYSWTTTSGTLPTGLSLKADGTLSGIATSAGASTFTVQVADTSQPTPQTASRSFTVNVTVSVAIAQCFAPRRLSHKALRRAIQRPRRPRPLQLVRNRSATRTHAHSQRLSGGHTHRDRDLYAQRQRHRWLHAPAFRQQTTGDDRPGRPQYHHKHPA